ncbi:MAG: glutamine--fructose-6-phosphate transaminase (isomerizing) [Caulobacterales bacterium]
MCGIVGVLGSRSAAPLIISALKRLEYRGYDSAGLAVLDHGQISRRRAVGKIRNLETVVRDEPVTGIGGIGHTRWATHGAPSVANAHPHRVGGVAIVHNGIVENFRELRAELAAQGYTFASDTDSEVLAALIARELGGGLDPAEAVKAAVKHVRGAYAVAALFAGEDDLLVGARCGSPLVAGLGDGEAFLGSDALAIAPLTRRVMYLEEGDVVVLRRGAATVYDASGAVTPRPVSALSTNDEVVEKGAYPHFMLKEIYEQPEVIARTLSQFIDPLRLEAAWPAGDLDFAGMRRLHIVACGTAHYAGRIAKYWFERLAGLPVECEIASEYRYRRPELQSGDAVMVISQSGETADTLAALRLAKAHGLRTIGLVNVATSTMARECDVHVRTLAGPEIGVASTKAFTTQLAALACLALMAARQRLRINAAEEAELAHALLGVPRLFNEALAADDDVAALAAQIAGASSALYLGRDVFYPLALEGALKLKEISYIHAEGFASGELKHGPIALVDPNVPLIMTAPNDDLFEKAVSALEEVAARGGRTILISDAAGIAKAGRTPWASIAAPTCHPFAAPIVYAAPLQLLAYRVAVLRGADVDQPRNLAKSVTVE